MPLTVDQYKEQLQRSLGGETVMPPHVLDPIWTRYDSVSDVELRYHRATVEAINHLLGTTWQKFEVRTAAGEVIHGEQPFEHLIQMAKLATSEIERIVSTAITAATAEYASPVTGVMEATHPWPTPVGSHVDPNSSRYQGDPLWWNR